METQAASALPRADSGLIPVISFRKPMEDKPPLREIFESEESALLRFAYGLTGQRETAEDLVQEAFLRLHAHWDEVEHPRAWLFRSVRNLALNHRRDHRRESALDGEKEWDSGLPDPGKELGKLEAMGTLRLLVAELREDERELIGLRYREGLKYEQISKKTGMSVGNVGYKLHHVLKGLGEALRRMGVEGAEG